ncbi:protein FAM83H [Cololabis saira]|uniref:protein FAM83H n=1 Tax=Cololabis saira TaxID=129043 RepID=UPI002AD501A4|nr:protein FAM83H [Cololabis saira]
MARRSQCSSAGDNPLDPNYLPPHYREEYRLAIDALVETDLEGYYQFLQKADVVDFLAAPEIEFIHHSVQAPQQSSHLEQQFLDSGGDGSSDTYWPIHSDLDVPGLDLGWPQMHPFIAPTEVTTLVNPPEPDMPSIKEQARRLIQNAQQVIAIVMDMFTDVDMFGDLLNAAMRNVAVYILLDEQNAHHFVNMVSNCRVNLQSIQFLRVRTVSGIKYQCRSGQSFKGQMMDRFLLTDCRAVLSGNYSFMWSFEKLHRCMAHLFLGQLVTTFDEEFRILFAQSQPLMMENMLAPMEEFGLLQKRQYPTDKAAFYREPRKFLSQDVGQPDQWIRHSYDERGDGDWRMMALKKQESLHGPGDMYRRQTRGDPSGGPLMDNPAHKRHSYAEGVHERYSSPFLQPGIPDTEVQGKYFQKGQQPLPEPSYYDKFWSQGCQSVDQYSEPGLPQDLPPSDNFDPVLNYLSSTRNLDFDQSSENVPPAADMPLNPSHPRRPGFGQPYVCQVSPTPSSSAEQKQFFQDPTVDRKDPTVKRGLRNWRINSYLSAYENQGEEGLPTVPAQADAFEEQTAPDTDLPALKIPNVREFKVPAVPRAGHMPSYAKTKTTPTPSESSSTAGREEAEAAERRELKTIGLVRDDSFRRKYNAAAPRSSRLRSSLIFSSLDQQTSQETSGTEQPDEQSDKNEGETTKVPFVSRVLGQRRSAAREPFEWSRYVKSSTFDNSSKPDDESSKGDDKDSSKDASENPVKESLKPRDDIPSPSLSRSTSSGAEQDAQPPKPLIKTPLYVDMNDADNRLMFFKELAAKRKAAKAAEAAKSKEKVQVKPPAELKEPLPNEAPESKALDNTAVSDSTTSQDVCDKGTKVSADSETAESAKTETCQTKPPEKPPPSAAPAKERSNPPTPTNAVKVLPLTKGTDESLKPDSASKELVSATPGSEEVPSSSEFDVKAPNVESVQLETNLLLAHEGNRGTELSSSNTSVQSPSCDEPLPGPAPPSGAAATAQTSRSKDLPGVSSSTHSAKETSSKSADLDSVPLSTSSETPSAADSALAASGISSDTSAAPETNTSYLQSSTNGDGSSSADGSEKAVSRSEKGDHGLDIGSVAEESEALRSPKADRSSLSLGVLGLSSLGSSAPTRDLNQTISPVTTPEPSQTSVLGRADTETASSPRDTPTQASTPHDLDLGFDEFSPAEPASLSPPGESDQSGLFPESRNTETDRFTSDGLSDKDFLSGETQRESEDSTDATSASSADVHLPCKASESDTPESCTPEPALSGESSKIQPGLTSAGERKDHNVEDTNKSRRSSRQDSVGSDQTSEPAETTTSKQPKSSPSRYHSSTANVLSSSNLRDDTKLLLEQISANSQSRNEAPKEPPVTDDEKEDEADKNAKKQKERGFRTLSRGQPKTPQEREKLLEKMQSLRKERKVYSRFEMAP